MEKNSASPYTSTFFNQIAHDSELSASRIVPELLKIVSPESVIDVGCGIGVWLSIFERQGVTDILGVDGDYVNRQMLRIDPKSFLSHNLLDPLVLGRTFDLALCLEVAEHLPENLAGGLVANLAALAPVVLFSAAIPRQRGTGHVNEQWPNYWARLFGTVDYVALDCVRPRIWNDKDIAWWYRQNTLLYVRRDHLESYPGLRNIKASQPASVPGLVHPDLWATRTAEPTLTSISRMILPAAKRALVRRLRFL